MKKILSIILLIAVTFIAFNQNVISWVKSNFTSNPTPYYQQRLEFFEELSREYYGVTDYGRELAVVNRSFVIAEISIDHAELIIPSREAITRLKERQSLESVEDQAGTQIVNTIRQLSNQAPGAEKVSSKVEHSKSSMVIIIVALILISLTVALFSYFKYRNKTKNLDMPGFPEDGSIRTDESILVNFDLTGYEEKNQGSNNVCLESGI